MQPIYHPGFTIIGIAEPVSLLALLVLVLLTPDGGASFWFYVAALRALALMHALYWTMTHPVNRFWLEGQQLSRAGGRFFGVGAGGSGADRNHVSTDWERTRRRWEYSHVWRAAFAVLALFCSPSALRGDAGVAALRRSTSECGRP